MLEIKRPRLLVADLRLPKHGSPPSSDPATFLHRTIFNAKYEQFSRKIGTNEEKLVSGCATIKAVLQTEQETWNEVPAIRKFKEATFL
jgi:hypothetical protein